jgi:hypothetical protein
MNAFGKYSPGVLLELENIRRCYARPRGLDDSCASPDRFMINQLGQNDGDSINVG